MAVHSLGMGSFPWWIPKPPPKPDHVCFLYITDWAHIEILVRYGDWVVCLYSKLLSEEKCGTSHATNCNNKVCFWIVFFAVRRRLVSQYCLQRLLVLITRTNCPGVKIAMMAPIAHLNVNGSLTQPMLGASATSWLGVKSNLKYVTKLK